LYRDTLVLKHSASDHISNAVKLRNSAAVAEAKNLEEDKRVIAPGPVAALTAALVDFLAEVR